MIIAPGMFWFVIGAIAVAGAIGIGYGLGYKAGKEQAEREKKG